MLVNAPHLLWSDSLFLPDDLIWELETKVIVWDPDDVESEEDEIPKIAEELGLHSSLGIQDIQAVVENAKEQINDCSVEQLFEAFLYDYDHDAFIEF